MAALGHAWTQASQPAQVVYSQLGLLSSMVIERMGHTREHVPHPMQASARR